MAEPTTATEQPSQPNDDWLTLTEAGQVSGVTRDAIYQRIKTGRIAVDDWKRGEGERSAYMVRRSALDKLVTNQPRSYTRSAASQPTPNNTHHIAYCSGYLTAWLEMYARGQRLVAGDLVNGVVEVMKGASA